MTDKEKLIQLIETGEQCNIDLGVYQWLAQGFPKCELRKILAAKLMLGKAFYDNGFKVEDYHLRYKYDPCGSFVILFCDKVALKKKRLWNAMDFYSLYQDLFGTVLDLIEAKLAKPE